MLGMLRGAINYVLGILAAVAVLFGFWQWAHRRKVEERMNEFERDATQAERDMLRRQVESINAIERRHQADRATDEGLLREGRRTHLEDHW